MNIEENALNNTDLIIKNNLTTINFDSKCIENIYKANNINETENIIVAKYDLVDTDKKYPHPFLIKPVEYNFYNSKTGKKIDSSVCEPNSLIVSYPLAFNLRNHNDNFTDKAEIKRIEKLIEIGKELQEEDENIDLFNSESPVYNDICISLKFEGKDVALQDRRTALFPNITVCENNCTPAYTDYSKERFYCKCNIKTEFDLNRDYDIDVKKFEEKETKETQRSPSNFAVIKCLKNISKDVKRMVKENPAFYITIISIAAQIGMVFTSGLYGYKLIMSKLAKKFEGNNQLIKGKNSPPKENINNIDEIDIFSSQKRLAQPPPKKEKNDDYSNFLDEYSEDQKAKGKAGVMSYQNNNVLRRRIIRKKVKVKKPKKVIIPKKIEKEEDISSIEQSSCTDKDKDLNNIKINPVMKMPSIDKKVPSLYSNEESLNTSEDKITENMEDSPYVYVENSDESLVRAIRKEDKNLREPFFRAIHTDKNSFCVVVLTEILTRVYLTKIFLLKKKYNMASLFTALYIVYHIILLTLSAAFFDIKKISKIYYETNFPNLSHYLLYGFISMLIAWVVYGLLSHLISFHSQTKKVINIKNNVLTKEEVGPQEYFELTLENLAQSMKKGIIAFYFWVFVIMLFCLIYLVSFCGVFIETKKYVFNAYGITLCEIAVIKFAYGAIIGVFRVISLKKKSKCLYQMCRIFDAYLI